MERARERFVAAVDSAVRVRCLQIVNLQEVEYFSDAVGPGFRSMFLFVQEQTEPIRIRCLPTTVLELYDAQGYKTFEFGVLCGGSFVRILDWPESDLQLTAESRRRLKIYLSFWRANHSKN